MGGKTFRGDRKGSGEKKKEKKGAAFHFMAQIIFIVLRSQKLFYGEDRERRKNFFVRHAFGYLLRNVDDNTLIEYFVGRGSPWFQWTEAEI